jgi:hypothetical protein
MESHEVTMRRALVPSSRRRLALAVLTFITVLTACSAEKLTQPEADPLVGQWKGSFESFLEPSSWLSQFFVLVVRTGGSAYATGCYVHRVTGVLVIERLFLQMEVEADGTLTGEGEWQLGGTSYPGSVQGILDVQEETGNGEFMFLLMDTTISIPWQVTKVIEP